MAAGWDAADETVEGLPARTTVALEEEEGREVWAPDIVPYDFAINAGLAVALLDGF